MQTQSTSLATLSPRQLLVGDLQLPLHRQLPLELCHAVPEAAVLGRAVTKRGERAKEVVETVSRAGEDRLGGFHDRRSRTPERSEPQGLPYGDQHDGQGDGDDQVRGGPHLRASPDHPPEVSSGRLRTSSRTSRPAPGASGGPWPSGT